MPEDLSHEDSKADIAGTSRLTTKAPIATVATSGSEKGANAMASGTTSLLRTTRC